MATARCFGSAVEREEPTGPHSGSRPSGSGDTDGGGAFGASLGGRRTDFIDAKISGDEFLSAYIPSSGLEDSFFGGVAAIILLRLCRTT
jgi:hypothetical protein